MTDAAEVAAAHAGAAAAGGAAADAAAAAAAAGAAAGTAAAAPAAADTAAATTGTEPAALAGTAVRSSGGRHNAPPSPVCLPSAKYAGAGYEPNPVLLRLAKHAAHPVCPRAARQRAAAAATTRQERVPLQAALLGPGRAGKPGVLLGTSSGVTYKGAVLGGLPHGQGQLWAPGPRPGAPLQLVYEGTWVRGERHGPGTAHFRTRGETYTGDWVAGRRHGEGKLVRQDGTVYQGGWRDDERHGRGMLVSPSGAIFVGSWVAGKRQGLGTTLWPARGKKYVAEFVNDAPTCGTFLELDDEQLELLPQQLRGALAAARLAAAATEQAQQLPSMPKLALVQPSRVLAREFVATRERREKLQDQQAGMAAHVSCSTLPASTVSLLRHSFILLAGGDDLAAHVLPHQLPELVVLAGLEPAAPSVRLLLQLLSQRCGSGGRLFLEDLLHVVLHFRTHAGDAAGASEQEQEQHGEWKQEQQEEQEQEQQGEEQQDQEQEEWKQEQEQQEWKQGPQGEQQAELQAEPQPQPEPCQQAPALI